MRITLALNSNTEGILLVAQALKKDKQSIKRMCLSIQDLAGHKGTMAAADRALDSCQ